MSGKRFLKSFSQKNTNWYDKSSCCGHVAQDARRHNFSREGARDGRAVEKVPLQVD